MHKSYTSLSLAIYYLSFTDRKNRVTIGRFNGRWFVKETTAQ